MHRAVQVKARMGRLDGSELMEVEYEVHSARIVTGIGMQMWCTWRHDVHRALHTSHASRSALTIRDTLRIGNSHPALQTRPLRHQLWVEVMTRAM